MLAAARQPWQQLLCLPCSWRKIITKKSVATPAAEPEKRSGVYVLRNQEAANNLGRKHISGAIKSGDWWTQREL